MTNQASFQISQCLNKPLDRHLSEGKWSYLLTHTKQCKVHDVVDFPVSDVIHEMSMHVISHQASANIETLESEIEDYAQAIATASADLKKATSIRAEESATFEAGVLSFTGKPCC